MGRAPPRRRPVFYTGASWTPLVLKKNREKSGELLDGKKPVRIKKPHGGGGERQKTQWDKKTVWGGDQALSEWDGSSRVEV